MEAHAPHVVYACQQTPIHPTHTHTQPTQPTHPHTPHTHTPGTLHKSLSPRQPENEEEAVHLRRRGKEGKWRGEEEGGGKGGQVGKYD